MTFHEFLGDMKGVLACNPQVIKQSVKRSHVGWVILTLIIVGLLKGILQILLSHEKASFLVNLVLVLFVPLLTLVYWLILIGLPYIVAWLLGAQAGFKQYFSVTGGAALLLFVIMLPLDHWVLGSMLNALINLVGLIWLLVSVHSVLKVNHNLTSGKAVLAVVLPFVILVGAVLTWLII